MPVVAVGIAAVAIGTAAASVAAAATLTLVTALEVVAAVGATISAVGVITHNKALTMVGAGLGLVGGIGGLAASAGVFGAEASTASLFGSSSAAGETAAAGEAGTAAEMATSGTAATSGGDVINSLAPSAGVSSEGSLVAANTGETATTSAVGPAVTPANAPQESVNLYATTSQPAQSGDALTNTILNGGQVAPPAQTPAPTVPPAVSPGTTPPPFMGSDGLPLPDPPIPPVEKGFFAGLLDFAHNNQTLVSGATQGVGQFISGFTNQLTPAQITALNAQAAANQAAANMTQFQQQNLTGPKPIASRTPVTGTPAPLITPVPGMINAAATTPPVNVTGAPV